MVTFGMIVNAWLHCICFSDDSQKFNVQQQCSAENGHQVVCENTCFLYKLVECRDELKHARLQDHVRLCIEFLYSIYFCFGQRHMSQLSRGSQGGGFAAY